MFTDIKSQLRDFFKWVQLNKIKNVMKIKEELLVCLITLSNSTWWSWEHHHRWCENERFKAYWAHFCIDVIICYSEQLLLSALMFSLWIEKVLSQLSWWVLTQAYKRALTKRASCFWALLTFWCRTLFFSSQFTVYWEIFHSWAKKVALNLWEFLFDSFVIIDSKVASRHEIYEMSDDCQDIITTKQHELSS